MRGGCVEKLMKVRGRFAPSPSGRMHLGNVLTALVSWLAVRSQGGTLVLRMEDLDPDRSREAHARAILEDLRWLGLDWDEGPDVGGPYGPYAQSERRELYAQWLERFREMGLVYPCICTRSELRDASAPHPGEGEPVYSGRCLRREEARHTAETGGKAALRLVVPDRTLRFDDLNFGPQAVNLKEACGDFIIRRSDGVHAYQLAVSVDDALMGITLVVRGEDLLESTARQIYIQQLMGRTAPRYGHVPLLVGADGRRLSKRHRDTDLGALRRYGVRPESILGFLAHRAGLAHTPEPVTAAALAEVFDWDRLHRHPVVIDEASVQALIEGVPLP